jgi:hypothetical protein
MSEETEIDDKMNEPMVTINWCPADIALATGLSDERSIEILEQIGKSLNDRSIELGWEVIGVLVQDYIDEGEDDE